jgi:hypothetical protein
MEYLTLSFESMRLDSPQLSSHETNLVSLDKHLWLEID